MSKTQAARFLALVGYFGLLFLVVSWQAWLAPPRVLPVALVIIFMAVPLLIPLRGLLHARPYTHAWTSFLALFYFVHGVVEVYSSPDERHLAALEILFSVMLYAGAIFYARFRGRELREPVED